MSEKIKFTLIAVTVALAFVLFNCLAVWRTGTSG